VFLYVVYKSDKKDGQAKKYFLLILDTPLSLPGATGDLRRGREESLLSCDTEVKKLTRE